MVDEFLRYLRGERNASPLTVRNYAADLAAFRGWYQEKFRRPCDWLAVDAFHARGYLAHLAERKLARATVHLKLSALRSFYRWLVRSDKTKENPLVGLAMPKKPRRLPQFLTVQQMEALLNAPVQTRETQNPLAAWRDKALLEILYSAGLRIHELVGLNDDDVDMLGEVVRVRGKGKKERLAPLGGPAVTTLQKYLALRNRAAREIGRAHV